MTYIQQPLFPPPTTWTPTPVSKLPSWQDAKRIAIDCETYDPLLTKLGPGVRRGGYIVGVSFAIENGPAFYLPTRHGSGRNMDEAQVETYLYDQARAFKGEVVGANLPYDLDYLEELGIFFKQTSLFRDVMVADPLICELHHSYSLENISKRWGFEGKDEGPMREAARLYGIDPTKRPRSDEVKANIWKLPPEYVAEYAISDVVLPLQILRKQEQEIEKQNLREVYDLESRLLPVLLKMRRRGVRIDKQKLQEISDWAELTEKQMMTSVELSIQDTMRAATLAPRLEEIGIKVPVTPKSRKPSVSAEVLQAHPHKVTNAILRARQFLKLRSTFCQQVWDQLIGDRVHCTFNQLKYQREGRDNPEGAGFGRCSSSNFNLTNQPIRHPEYGKMWRSIFIPDEGCEWAKCDFSAQEPRLTVHLGEMEGHNSAKKLGNRWRKDPNLDVHGEVATWINKERDMAKIVFLGLCYNKGQRRLCEELGLPVGDWNTFTTRKGKEIRYREAGPEGKAILSKFHELVPFVRKMSHDIQEAAEERGWIRTLLGRRCRFKWDEEEQEYKDTSKGLNRWVQGSAGDQTKKAMVDIDAAGYNLQIMVHDEISGSRCNRQEAEEVARIMEHAVKLTVPSMVDVEIGNSWGTVK
jgi:DNA polymerase I-like protein with 3'-5' exonuclease and polymerase domains